MDNQNQTEDRGYELFEKLMDTVFELADELDEVDEEDLTDAEIDFLNALGNYCEFCCEEENN